MSSFTRRYGVAKANNYDPNRNIPLTLVSIHPHSGSTHGSIVSSRPVTFSAPYAGTASFAASPDALAPANPR
ncbi:hypothetical protein [Sphingomonas sp. IBVSS2]|uniref:hypothetical protein n=1 Tax=Sphingomonas sp. IBVSS2 TaxID=1985172 RepID=UPI0015C4EB7C|nr:hypothetical protein [Sphingomonas sp. IBVSS2]